MTEAKRTRYRRVPKTVTLCLGILLAGAAQLHAVNEMEPANVILIIGDGMDDPQITIARNYLVGAQGRLTLDRMSLRSTSQVITISSDDPSKIIYVADSANSATSIASGILTSRGRIGTDPYDRDHETIVEIAEAAGLRTGLVTTASITDATPAAFATHISRRFCHNPDAMVDIKYKGLDLGGCPEDLLENGGNGSISQQLAGSDIDVLLGGGHEHFEPTAEAHDKSVRDLAIDNGYQFVDSPEEIEAVSLDKKILGLFTESKMPVRLRGENGRLAEEPEASLLNHIHWLLGSVELPEPMRCEADPEFADTPTLKRMTEAALKRLDQNNEKGFFLMVESASIDKQAHERDACGSIGELKQLDEALESALSFAEEHPNTLILVTADHGQAAQLIPNISLMDSFGFPVFTPGRMSRLITKEGSVMGVNYATTGFLMEDHTGAQVPLYSNETGIGLVPAMTQQKDLFEIILTHLNLKPSQEN